MKYASTVGHCGRVDVLVDSDTRLLLQINADGELTGASCPQYGDAIITRSDSTYLLKLIDPCGNKLAVQLDKWFDPVILCSKFVLRWAIKEEYAND